MKYQSLGISGERTASPFFSLCLHDRLLLFFRLRGIYGELEK